MYKHHLRISVGACALALLLPATGRADVPPAPVTARTTATATATATASATASASVSATFKISDAEALSDDILAVIDLPLAAAEAREVGVEETELQAALDVTRTVGLSAGEASEVITEEAEATTKRGSPNKGFGQWVRMQVAAGLRGQALAAKIRDRKAELKELSPEEDEKIKIKLGELSEKYKARQAKLLERRQELVGKGKAKVLVAKERHEKHEQRLAAAAERINSKNDALEMRLRVLEGKMATVDGDKKAAFEAERQRLLKALGRVEKAEDKLAKAEDKLEKREDKLEKAEDRLEKAEDKLEKKQDKLEKKDKTAKQGGSETQPPVPRPDEPKARPGKAGDKTSKGAQ